MKFATDRPFADPDQAARKLVEIANASEAVQDGRIYIELINGPFLKAGARPTSSAPPLRARSRWAGCGGMNPGPM
jgi:hypothetical protein